MVPLDVLCDLVMEKKSAIRAALIRRNAVETLIDNIEFDNALVALCELAKFRTGLRFIAQFNHDIVVQLCREPKGRKRSSMLVFLLSRLQPPTDPVFRNYLVTGLLKHVDPVLAFNISKLLARTLVPGLDLVAILEDPECDLGNGFDWSLRYVYSCIVAHSTGSARWLTRRFGKELVQHFVHHPDNEVLTSFLPSILEHVSVSWYDDLLVDACFNLRSCNHAVAILYRMLQSDVEIYTRMKLHSEWSRMLTSLLPSLIEPSHASHKTVRLFLLQLLVIDDSALAPTVLQAVATHVQTIPTHFAFAPTTNLKAAERIVEVGKRIGLSDDNLRVYIDNVCKLKEDDRIRRRMDAIGLAQILQPDAFHCPITMEIMDNPVVASDGHTYEQSALAHILRTTRKSPLTRETLNCNIMIPNINLKKRIRNYSGEICSVVEAIRNNCMTVQP